MRKKPIKLLALLLAALSAFLLCSCFEEKPPVDNRPKMYAEDMLSASGNHLVNKLGDEVILRGTNAGGYLVLEPWMSAIPREVDGESVDHLGTTETFVKRFGKEKTLELWEYYRSVYWQESDFENCANMGFNVIRLPFTYMSVDPQYSNVRSNGEKYNFEILDAFVRNAEAYGMYTILDLHGAYGSQNGQHHSGEIIAQGEVTFYSDEENMQKTEDLWVAVAEHFKDNPAVAGYDLLNEPAETQVGGGQTTSKVHWDYFDRLYKAIRKVDNNHVIIMESCWEPYNLPNPKTYGWENCMYSLHHYSHTDITSDHLASFAGKKSSWNSVKYDLPVYMGEFCCYTSIDSWEGTFAYLKEWGWSWTSWTYKLDVQLQNGRNRYLGWSVYAVYAENADVVHDSYDEIKQKWSLLETSKGDICMLSGGKTLYEIYESACRGE